MFNLMLRSLLYSMSRYPILQKALLLLMQSRLEIVRPGTIDTGEERRVPTSRILIRTRRKEGRASLGVATRPGLGVFCFPTWGCRRQGDFIIQNFCSEQTQPFQQKYRTRKCIESAVSKLERSLEKNVLKGLLCISVLEVEKTDRRIIFLNFCTTFQ